LEEKE
jgi:hypothetical protein